MLENPEEAELSRYLLEIATKIAPQIAKETHAQYLERILTKFSWCVGMGKYVYALLNEAPIILASMNSQGDFVIINETASSLLGYTPNELVGQNFSFLCADEQRLSVKSLISQKLSFSKDLLFEATLLTKDGLAISMLWDLVWSESAALYTCAAQKLTDRLAVPELNSLTS